MRLDGKVAVVTGASSGIGRAASIALARAGAKVVGVARRKELLEEVKALIESEGGVFLPYCGDLLDDNVVNGMIDTAVEKFGKIDILVNNAGKNDQNYPVEVTDDERWDYHMNLLLTVPMKAIRHAIPYMKEQGGGSIINIASVGAIRNAIGGAAYTSAKTGLIGLSKNTAYLYAEKNIRSNVICPGAVNTDCVRPDPNDPPDPYGFEHTTKVCSSMVRLAEPEEFGDLIVFLASDGSSLVNGAVINADNGYSAG